MPKNQRENAERCTALECEMETLRTQLNLMICGDRQKLAADEVYQLSIRLDNLIVKYMRVFA